MLGLGIEAGGGGLYFWQRQWTTFVHRGDWVSTHCSMQCCWCIWGYHVSIQILMLNVRYISLMLWLVNKNMLETNFVGCSAQFRIWLSWKISLLGCSWCTAIKSSCVVSYIRKHMLTRHCSLFRNATVWRFYLMTSPLIPWNPPLLAITQLNYNVCLSASPDTFMIILQLFQTKNINSIQSSCEWTLKYLFLSGFSSEIHLDHDNILVFR